MYGGEAMKSPWTVGPALAGGLSILAACSSQTFVYDTKLSSSYRPIEYGYGAGGRDLTTVIVGNPFAIDQSMLDAKLVSQLNSHPTLLQPNSLHHHARSERAAGVPRGLLLQYRDRDLRPPLR